MTQKASTSIPIARYVTLLQAHMVSHPHHSRLCRPVEILVSRQGTGNSLSIHDTLSQH